MSDTLTQSSPPCTVVLVDDDLTIRWALRGVLKRLGFLLVAEVTNGEEAVAAVSRNKPDIVLLDVCMPFQTGPNALPAILAAHEGAKIVMLTSMADEATVRDCVEKGAEEYLRKDTSVEELSQVLVGLRARIVAERESLISHGTHQATAL